MPLTPLSRRTPRRATGDAFELAALRHLRRAGLRLLQRNFSTRLGEIDLVMRDGDTLVFVEVRYRHDLAHGGATASIDKRKQRRLIRAAQSYLLLHPASAQRPCRFDVVSFDGVTGHAHCQWLRGAFEND